MKKTILSLLILSLLFLVAVSFATKHFLALYYVVWVGGVGAYTWKNREALEIKLRSWRISGFMKFILLGVCMILLEETLAGISMYTATAQSVTDIVVGIFKYWALNLLLLPGFIFGWYFLLKRFSYTRKEIFTLVGIFGLWAEKMYINVFISPIMTIALFLPTMFTYMVIIAPSILSFKIQDNKRLPWYLRYILGLIVPFLFSIPLVGVAMYLKAHYPEAFPPAGFVQ